jgi:hypothetical protein
MMFILWFRGLIRGVAIVPGVPGEPRRMMLFEDALGK